MPSKDLVVSPMEWKDLYDEWDLTPGFKVGSTGGGATGTGVVKAGALELRPVQDPRTIVEYVTGS